MARQYVCEACIEDADLQEVVRANVISESCDYCGLKAKTAIAAELSDVLDRIRFTLDQYYTDPANFVYWNGREGGWQGHPVLETWEAIDNLGLSLANDDLQEDIVGTFFDEQFADEDFWPGPTHERQLTSWKRFKQVVKHRRRFTFWTLDDESISLAEWQPKEMLQAIAMTIRELPIEKSLPPGERFWRVRVHDVGRNLTKTKDFTSPPIKRANYPNRMSPSGIPMFYGAEDFDTAVKETVDPSRSEKYEATGVAFQNVRPLNILDLTAVPKKPGIFSGSTRYLREAVDFLNAFTLDISRPVKKDGRQHIEYVPTQVFTEFIRFEFKTEKDEQFDGIRYPSSKNRRGCYVLFVEQDECIGSKSTRVRPQVLEIVRRSRKTVEI